MIESFTEGEMKEKIDLYINGQLSEEEIDELWAELIQDGYHLEYLKTAANLRDMLIREREREEAAAPKQYRYYAAAAVIALLIGLVTIFTLPQFNTGTEVRPIETIELDYYRSADGSVTNGNEHQQVIREAITLANAGKFNEAVNLLKNERQKASSTKWVAELNLNLGALYYNENQFGESTAYFEEVIAEKEELEVLTVEKAYWYLGNAYFQLDQLDKARANIEQAYELNGAYRRVAQSYLNALAAR